MSANLAVGTNSIRDIFNPQQLFTRFPTKYGEFLKSINSHNGKEDLFLICDFQRLFRQNLPVK